MNLGRVVPFVASVALAFCATALRADTYYFNAGGVGIHMSGQLTVTPDGNPGEFKVTGISGIINGAAITGLVPTSAGTTAANPTNADGFLFDNLIFTNDPHVNLNGILFNIAGTTPGNIYYENGYQFYDYNGTIGPVSFFSVSQVPEPSSLALLGSGLLGLGMTSRRVRS